MHTKVTSNITNDRNPKTFEVGLSASAHFTKLEMFPQIAELISRKECTKDIANHLRVFLKSPH